MGSASHTPYCPNCLLFAPVFSSSLISPASSKNCLDPEFLKAIPIMKTRSGMQVGPSAAPTFSGGCVWVFLSTSGMPPCRHLPK